MEFFREAFFRQYVKLKLLMANLFSQIRCKVWEIGQTCGTTGWWYAIAIIIKIIME